MDSHCSGTAWVFVFTLGDESGVAGVVYTPSLLLVFGENEVHSAAESEGWQCALASMASVGLFRCLICVRRENVYQLTYCVHLFVTNVCKGCRKRRVLQCVG